ncbi:MAG TPA: dihydrodipicolinate reductase C-terminal domain-containing protein, partial [Vicinamibacterales bacterium]
ETNVGVVAASNFSLGANLFQSIVEYAAKQFGRQADYGAWIHEAHHAAKKDAPSGTAVTLRAAMQKVGYDRGIDVSSTRAGSIPGTHTVGFDGSSDTITLTHTNRDRGAFARGALEAARWVIGRRGWFGMKDVLGG